MYIPLPPIPAITRPTIKAFMFGAAPHNALPTSKMKIEVLSSHLMLKTE